MGFLRGWKRIGRVVGSVLDEVGVILALFGFMLLASWTELGSAFSRLTERTLDYDPLFRRSLSKLEQLVLLLIIFVVPAFIGIIVGERHKSARTA
jgi:hypothetical protein